MAWFYLIVAGLLEIGFTSCLGKIKETSGSTMYLWIVGFMLCMASSLFLLLKAIQTLPLGTAYAVWTGIGAVGTVLVGILFFNEPAGVWRMVFIFTLVASIVGLKFVSN